MGCAPSAMTGRGRILIVVDLLNEACPIETLCGLQICTKQALATACAQYLESFKPTGKMAGVKHNNSRC